MDIRLCFGESAKASSSKIYDKSALASLVNIVNSPYIFKHDIIIIII